MNTPYASLIYDAVCLNSVPLLRGYLDTHATMDVNLDISSALPSYEDVVTVDGRGQVISSNTQCFVSQLPRSNAAVCTALHLAIVECHAKFSRIQVGLSEERPSLEMIRFLLCRGTNPMIVCCNISLPYLRLDAGNGAVVFLGNNYGFDAMSLVQTLLSMGNMDNEARAFFQQVMDTLQYPAKEISKTTFPTAKLLFSETLSDVTFVCSDDQEQLPAHKCILASSSDYFETFFDGPWGEQHPDGRWTTDYTSDVIELFLTFVYTGEVTLDGFDGDDDVAVITRAQAVMKLAHEWGLPELFFLAEVKCSLSLSLESLPAMMTKAQLYDAKVLKNQCTRFLKENLIQVVVTHPHFTSTLASNYPELWGELAGQLRPAPKTQRTGTSNTF